MITPSGRKVCAGEEEEEREKSLLIVNAFLLPRYCCSKPQKGLSWGSENLDMTSKGLVETV
jgi:hypothetical protein